MTSLRQDFGLAGLQSTYAKKTDRNAAIRPDRPNGVSTKFLTGSHYYSYYALIFVIRLLMISNAVMNIIIGSAIGMIIIPGVRVVVSS